MIVPRGDGKKYRKLGFQNVYSHSWWHRTTIPFTKNGVTEHLKITAVPANHWSGTGPCDGHRSMFLGYVIEQEDGDIYFAGDTARLSDEHIATLRDRFTIRVQFQPGGPDEMRKDMETTHQASVDGLWMHFNLILKGIYESGHYASKPKGDFMEIAKACKTIYMHTKTFKLGNLHFDDTETSVRKVIDSLTDRNPQGLKSYEEKVWFELRDLGLKMTFDNGNSNLQAADVQELLNACVEIPRIGERTSLE
jgi:L-ascorbate metabolism protein UlaG (beta-lactamase superfamily)